MDIGGHGGSGRIRFDNLREDHSPWNMVNQQHQVKEHNNLLNMNKKYLNILAERDAAIEERNRALLEKKKALDERESAISQRNLAIRERNEAILERDNALNALRHSLHNNPHSPNPTTTGFGVNQAGRADGSEPYSEMQILDALCRTVAAASQGRRKRTKEDSNGTMANKGNKRVEPGQVLKVKNDWDGQVLGLNRVDYDESVMPVPGCSCTGVFRHCYRWGNGGWQSACCTTSVSAYPLPPVPNRRYARMGGRKMSGSAFSKLLSRLAAEGFDFSVPVDLKDRWSKHGTNRYITIK